MMELFTDDLDADLLSCIPEFQSVTSCDAPSALFYLRAMGGSLPRALDFYFQSGGSAHVEQRAQQYQQPQPEPVGQVHPANYEQQRETTAPLVKEKKAAAVKAPSAKKSKPAAGGAHVIADEPTPLALAAPPAAPAPPPPLCFDDLKAKLKALIDKKMIDVRERQQRRDGAPVAAAYLLNSRVLRAFVDTLAIPAWGSASDFLAVFPQEHVRLHGKRFLQLYRTFRAEFIGDVAPTLSNDETRALSDSVEQQRRQHRSILRSARRGTKKAPRGKSAKRKSNSSTDDSSHSSSAESETPSYYDTTTSDGDDEEAQKGPKKKAAVNGSRAPPPAAGKRPVNGNAAAVRHPHGNEEDDLALDDVTTSDSSSPTKDSDDFGSDAPKRLRRRIENPPAKRSTAVRGKGAKLAARLAVNETARLAVQQRIDDDEEFVSSQEDYDDMPDVVVARAPPAKRGGGRLRIEYAGAPAPKSSGRKPAAAAVAGAAAGGGLKQEIIAKRQRPAPSLSAQELDDILKQESEYFDFVKQIQTRGIYRDIQGGALPGEFRCQVPVPVVSFPMRFECIPRDELVKLAGLRDELLRRRLVNLLLVYCSCCEESVLWHHLPIDTAVLEHLLLNDIVTPEEYLTECTAEGAPCVPFNAIRKWRAANKSRCFGVCDVDDHRKLVEIDAVMQFYQRTIKKGPQKGKVKRRLDVKISHSSTGKAKQPQFEVKLLVATLLPKSVVAPLAHVIKSIALLNVMSFIAERSPDPSALQNMQQYPLTPGNDLMKLFLDTSLDPDQFNFRGIRMVNGAPKDDRFMKLLGLASVSAFDDDNPLPQEAAPANIMLPLKRHQRESLAFALRAERNGTRDAVEMQLPGCPGITILFNQLNLSIRFFLSTETESLRIANPRVRGGFLCDEMGLGKTLVVLSLIAANPYPVPLTEASPSVPVPVEERWHSAALAKEVPLRVPNPSDFDSDDEEVDDGVQVGDVVHGVTFPQDFVGKVTPHLKLIPNPLLLPNMQKTEQLRESAQYRERHQLTPIKATLVIIPVSICGQWASEIKRCAPHLKYIVYHGQERHHFTLDNFRDADVILSTYETIAKQVREENLSTLMVAVSCRPSGVHAGSVSKHFKEKREKSKNDATAAAFLKDIKADALFNGYVSFRKPDIQLSRIKFHRLVLDESQKCTGSMDDVVDSLHADLRWAVTGTPINQNMGSLAKLFKAIGCRANHTPYDLLRDLEATGVSGYSDPKSEASYANLPTRFKIMKDVATELEGLLSSGNGALAHKRLTNPRFDQLAAAPVVRRFFQFYSLDDDDDDDDAHAVRNRAFMEEMLDQIGQPVRRYNMFYVGIITMKRYMIRHIKSSAILSDITLPPRTIVGVPVTLSADEMHIFQQIEARIKQQFAILARQDRVGNRMSRVLMWIDLLQRSATHHSLASETRLSKNENDTAGARNENAKHNFVPIDPQELHRKLLTLDGVPTSTMEALVKMGGVPPEVEDCTVCMCTMAQPTLLKCHHFFCRECVLQVISTAHDDPLCPACRKHTLVREKYVISLAADVVAPEFLAGLDDIKSRLANHGANSKVDAVIGLVAHLTHEDPTNRFVIFSRYPVFLKMLEKKFATSNLPYIVIDGSTTMKRRSTLIEQFQQHGGVIKVCMVTSRAGNAGLTLTAANHLILSEPGLNEAVELQAMGRIHRFGQTRPVTIHKMFTVGTIEEQIYNMGTRGQLAGQGGQDAVAQAMALLS